MASKIEVLEFLLLHYPNPVRYADVRHALKCRGTDYILDRLYKARYIEKLVEVKPGIFIDYKTYRRMYKKPIRRVYARLKEHVVEWVKQYARNGRVSFLFTPSAEVCRQWLKRPEKKFIFE